MAELKRIDFESGKFVANGTEYIIEGALSIERYAELQLFEKELANGMTFQTMFDKLQSLYSKLNKQKFADCAVELNDMIRGYAKLQEREPAILKICTLYINAKEEDRRTWNADMMNAKIADWKTEGIDMRDFFAVASSSIGGFSEVYRKVTRIISGQTDSEAEGNP